MKGLGAVLAAGLFTTGTFPSAFDYSAQTHNHHTLGDHGGIDSEFISASRMVGTQRHGTKITEHALQLNDSPAMRPNSISIAPKMTPVCAERVIGGGSIIGPAGTRASFGIGSGIKNGAFWGNLKYYDYGVDVRGMGGTVHIDLGRTTRRIEGNAAVNGKPGFTYQIDVGDNSDNGRSDTFTIRLSNGYAASGILVGGNILLDSTCEISQGDIPKHNQP